MQSAIVFQKYYREIKAIFILNILDMFLTWYALGAGYIEEANPLMNILYHGSPVLFIAFKLIAISLILLLVNHVIHSAAKKKQLLLLLYVPIAAYCMAVILNIYYYILISAQNVV